MAVFRTQNKVPAVYCDQSRDFQLLCRLYDAVFNSVKFDIDSMEKITDTSDCRSDILPLLSTKLGFFTRTDIETSHYRYILNGFPYLIRNKGSIASIRYAMNLFLKMHHIVTDISVWYTEEGTTVNHTKVNDHTIIIGIEAALKNTYILEEIFKYILPIGYGFYIYFYNSIEEIDSYINKDEAVLIFVSDNINAQVRSNNIEIDATKRTTVNDYYNRLIGAVDTVSIDTISSVIPTENGTYNPGDSSMFIGIFKSIPSIDAIEGNIALIKETDSDNYKEYIYTSGEWKERQKDSNTTDDFILNQTKQGDAFNG